MARKTQARQAGRQSAQERFSQIPEARIPRSVFDRSSGLKSSFDSGFLVPIFVDEALPGDTHTLQGEYFCRLTSPLQFPIMDGLVMQTFFFAVPLRLVWDNFEKFMGAQDNPGDSTDFLVPQCTAPSGGFTQGSLADYMGIPIGVESDVNALHFRAYNLIYNEWFRDQNLQDSVTVNTDDGPDAFTDYENYGSASNEKLLRRGKRHDYFTSCLPAPQKGAAVELPLGSVAPVVGAGDLKPEFLLEGTTAEVTLDTVSGTTSGPAGYTRIAGTGNSGGEDFLWNDTKLEADLSTATAATINQLRQAFQLQKLAERDMRGGTRYTEIVRSHFQVVSPDQRLQRPEYLGSHRQFVTVNPVANTGNVTLAIGDLGAYADSYGSARGWTKSFTEHCVIIGLAHIRASDLNYQQGFNRMWHRQTKYDFYWPALSMIGEQAVLSKEIWADGSASDEDVFGYQERYAEYRYKPSVITGAMRSTAATPLDYTHLGQDFATRPTLSDAFIEDDPPVSRVVAVPSENEFLLDAFFSMRSVRPMPTYGVPGMIDHF